MKQNNEVYWRGILYQTRCCPGSQGSTLIFKLNISDTSVITSLFSSSSDSHLLFTSFVIMSLCSRQRVLRQTLNAPQQASARIRHDFIHVFCSFLQFILFISAQLNRTKSNKLLSTQMAELVLCHQSISE